MSDLDEILSTLWTKETPFGQQVQGGDKAKRAIKKLILDLYKEVDYEPFEFVDRVSKL